MAVNVFDRPVSRIFLFTMAMITTGLLLVGCSGDGGEDASSSASDSSPGASQEQQAEPGQMPQRAPQTLSASDVNDEELRTAASIALSVQMSTRQDRIKMQKEMKEKYGNPQQMDSTQKAKARTEMRRRQMEMQKKQMKIMQQQAEEEGMEPKRFRAIMRSAQQDSTLRTRLQQTMKEQMKQRQPQGMQGPGQQNP